MSNLFSHLTPEAEQIINDNIDLVNKHIYDWVQNERKISSGIHNEVLVYLAARKRRENPSQQEVKKTVTRRMLITKLVREGYSLDDFKRVIDFKVSKWWGTDMQGNLSPETLFSNKFTKYLEEATENESSKIPGGMSKGLHGFGNPV